MTLLCILFYIVVTPLSFLHFIYLSDLFSLTFFYISLLRGCNYLLVAFTPFIFSQLDRVIVSIFAMVSPLDCSFAWGFRSFISLGFQYLLYYLIPYFGRISNVMLSKFRIISIRFGFLELNINTLLLVQCILCLALSLCII